jgi:transmembrane sensor
MPDDARQVSDEAIAWHLRLPGAGPAEWRAFTLWLEQSPDHAETYDAIARDDALLTEALRPGDWQPAPEDVVIDARPDRWWGHWRWGVAAAGTAIAAGAGFVLLPIEVGGAADPLVLQTAPGVRHTARLADGTTIAMNGDTRVTVDRADPRRVTLERGEAMFDVHHDAARPFEVLAGGVRLQDVGTMFNVVREDRRLSLQVAEGAVMFRPDRERLTLTEGAALSIADGDRAPRLTKVAAGEVGGWRHDRLAFSATPLPAVATALVRNLGGEVTVDPALATTRFTGSLSLAGGSDAVVPRLARLLDTGWTRVGRRWTLTPRNHDPR